MEAGFLPGIAVYPTLWFPERYRARAVGGYIIAGSVSAVLGGPLSTTIMTYANGAFRLQGWQWMFLIEGVPAVVLGLLMLRLLTERPAEATWLTLEQRSWLEATLVGERATLGDAKHPSLWLVLGDEDGVLAIAPADVAAVMEGARRQGEKEAAALRSIAAGQFDRAWVELHEKKRTGS